MTNTAHSPTPETSHAPALVWTDSLHTGDVRMDETHREFIDMIHQILATPEDEQLPVYKAFLNHTVEHFAQEERWMLATGFSADNCHAGHHATILETMRVVEAHYRDNDTVLHTDARLLPTRRKAWAAWTTTRPSSPAWPKHWPNGSRATPPAWTLAWLHTSSLWASTA